MWRSLGFRGLEIILAFGHSWFWPNLVWPKLVLAKLGWFWPNLVLAKVGFGHTWFGQS